MNDPNTIGDPRQHIHELSEATVWAANRQMGVVSPAADGSIPHHNYIDDEIFGKMDQDKVTPAPLSTDEEFIRRVTLDLTGRIPTAAQAQQFVADSSKDKRDKLVESLIGTPEFVDRWTMFFGDLLKNTARSSNVVRYQQGRNAFYTTIKSAIQENTPYDKVVTSLITQNGNNFNNQTGNTNFSIGAITPMGPRQDTLDTAAVQSAKAFLGIETLDCLLCHNGAGHLNALNVYGSTITREQAWGMSAFFSRLGTRTNVVTRQPLLINWDVFDLPAGDYQLNTNSGNRQPRQPIDGVSVIKPQYLFNGEKPNGNENYRAAFARILTRDRQFARATVNYLWAHFFGMGIVDPPTAFDLARLDPKNPPPDPWTLQPTNPALLEKLTDDFIAGGYNLQSIMRTITKSSTYQLSSRYPGEWKEEYTPYFARKFVRRLDAEEMFDAIARATGITSTYTVYGLSPVQWAMQLPDTVEPVPYPGQQVSQDGVQLRTFLDTFGRGDRDQVKRSNAPSILQGLSLMNSQLVITRLRSSATSGTISTLNVKNPDDRSFINDMFLTVLSRQPSQTEMNQALPLVKGNRTQGGQDLLWVLLNKIDFLYNY